MAELADAADSKSAGTWYLGGSIPPPGTISFPNAQEETMTESSRPVGQESTQEHLERARTLLNLLREKLDKHPELEEAIDRVEMALSALTVKSGGML